MTFFWLLGSKRPEVLKPRAQFTNNFVFVRRRKKEQVLLQKYLYMIYLFIFARPQETSWKDLELAGNNLEWAMKCRAVIYEYCQYTLILDDKKLEFVGLPKRSLEKHLFSVFIMLHGFPSWSRQPPLKLI